MSNSHKWTHDGSMLGSVVFIRTRDGSIAFISYETYENLFNHIAVRECKSKSL